MEEVIAKSVRKLYIVTYSICFFLSFVLIGLGALTITINIIGSVAVLLGGILIGLGVFLLGASLGWGIYFIKLPAVAISLKDGKLHFRNGVVCSPVEMDYFKAKTSGLDGEIFNFGKLIISVKGKEFKLNFVDRADSVVQRLFILKAEYSVKEHLAKEQQNAAAQPVEAAQSSEAVQSDTSEENNQENGNG